MKRDLTTLRAVGEALYGTTWQSELARELGVAVRTVQRWANGQRGLPDNLWSELAQLCVKRSGALTSWAGRLMQ